MLQVQGRNQSVKKIRIPLDHPQCEQLANRISVLLFAGELTENECGRLIKKGRELRKADRFLARVLYDRPLIATSLRPLFWNWAGVMVSTSQAEIASGWCHRLREYIERLEVRCFGNFARALNTAVGDNDDI